MMQANCYWRVKTVPVVWFPLAGPALSHEGRRQPLASKSTSGLSRQLDCLAGGKATRPLS